MNKALIAALAGGLSVTTYAPLEWWWLMPFCIISLYALLQTTSAKQSFYLAFLFGLMQFGIGASWVYVSLTTYGNMPMLMASAGVLIFVAALAFFTGLVGWCFSYLRSDSNPFLNVLVFSSLWVLSEWLRSVVLTGFPWLDVGYSQTTQWLSGFAAIGSVYLVSFACVTVSTLLFTVLQIESITKKVGAVTAVLTVIVVGAIIKDISWSQAADKAHSVALIQGNVPIEEKWKPSYKGTLLTNYYSQIQQFKADLVVLPETALPVYLDQTDEYFWQQMRGENKAILAGVVERNFATSQIFNSAALSCHSSPENPSLQIYRKQHLVPFGEYLPLRALFSWVLDYLQLPMADLSSGTRDQTLSCGGMNINLSICYEDAFTAGVRTSFNAQNGILVNISEDAWFGDSFAPHQRVQMAQMRAQELSRPILRSANSGPSTYIDHLGDIQASTKQFEKEEVLVSVFPRTGLTPYAQFGLWIVWLSTVFLLVVSVLKIRKPNLLER